MNKEHTQTLLNDFPKLYQQYKLPMDKTCMCWGFEILDGWFNMIYELSEKIVVLDPKCEAVQVKEKFGGLRFYVDNTTKEVHDLLHEYEEKSYKICEMCGKKGELRQDRAWSKTLCKKHNDYLNSPQYLLDKRKSRGDLNGKK